MWLMPLQTCSECSWSKTVTLNQNIQSARLSLLRFFSTMEDKGENGNEKTFGKELPQSFHKTLVSS